MKLADDVLASVERYFNILPLTGYVPYDKVDRLVAYMFLEEILYGQFALFVNEKDYRTISHALDCLYGTCMIPFPDYRKGIDLKALRRYNQYRITETDILRSSEEDNLRTKA